MLTLLRGYKRFFGDSRGQSSRVSGSMTERGLRSISRRVEKFVSTVVTRKTTRASTLTSLVACPRYVALDLRKLTRKVKLGHKQSVDCHMQLEMFVKIY